MSHCRPEQTCCFRSARGSHLNFSRTPSSSSVGQNRHAVSAPKRGSSAAVAVHRDHVLAERVLMTSGTGGLFATAADCLGLPSLLQREVGGDLLSQLIFESISNQKRHNQLSLTSHV